MSSSLGHGKCSRSVTQTRGLQRNTNKLGSALRLQNEGCIYPKVSQRRSVVVYADTPSEAFLTQAGTPVPQQSICIVGATGTLGRQVVKMAIDQGYDVRCLVKPRLYSADFLRDWGAQVVQADLTDPTSLPAALVGVSAIVDCATARPEESTSKIDWEGKVALIQTAQALKIKRFIFCSIANCDQYPDVPLMNIKHTTEQFLSQSGLDYTVMRFTGFMQALISNFAVPILEEREVWGTQSDSKTAYIDSQDAARMVLAALRSDVAVGKTYTCQGTAAYTDQEIIELCEKYAESKAKVNNVPLWLIKLTRSSISAFQWARDAADRLAFVEVMQRKVGSADSQAAYKDLDIKAEELTTLDGYLEDYYSRVLNKLKEAGSENKQTNIYL